MNLEERKYLTKQMKRLSGLSAKIVEVGSWVGVSSVAIAKGIKRYCPSSSFYCVDIFSKEYYASVPGLEAGTTSDILCVFEKNMRDYPHQTMVTRSLDAAASFGDGALDFVFIDADHSYEAAKADILAWLPKLKKGSVMCGHDYTKKEYGVKRAVDEVFGVCKLPARSMWEIIA